MKQSFRMMRRHQVLAVLFTASVISWIDRTAMAVTLPYIKSDLRMTAVEAGLVMSAFFLTYSISQIPGGLLADRFGVRRITTFALVWWSILTAVTGSVTSFAQMIATRLLFGLGEGAFFPCTAKGVALWFPKRNRGSANAIMLSSSRLGAAMAPFLVIWMMSTFGSWRYVFLGLCVPGFIIAGIYWLFIANSPYDDKKISREELRELNMDDVSSVARPVNPFAALRDIARDPVILRFLLIYFIFDIAYWGYLSWVPTYLVEKRGFTVLQMGVGASLPFLAGTVGVILGGWISDRWFVERRRIPIVASVLAAAAFFYLTLASSSVGMVLTCQGFAGLMLNIFFGSFWALPVSTMRTERLGITSGFINTGGQLGASLAPVGVGAVITLSGGSYNVAFAFLIACLIVVAGLASTLPSRPQYRSDPLPA